MTKHWFDRLSQSLAGRTSRRQSLRLIALLAGSLVLSRAADGVEAKKPKKKPQKGKGKGKGNNRKPNKKPGNANTKKPTSPPPPSTPGPDQCGEKPCAPGEICVSGGCMCADPRGPHACCPEGQTYCGSGCVDTTSHNDHCGGCGQSCPSLPSPGKVCIAGSCQCPPDLPVECTVVYPNGDSGVVCRPPGSVCCGQEGTYCDGNWAKCCERPYGWACLARDQICDGF